MKWQVVKIIHYPEHKRWGDGYAHLGFHDKFGRKYTVDYDRHWVGCYEADRLLWTFGQKPVEESPFHVEVDLKEPTYIGSSNEGELLIASTGNKKIYRFVPETRSVTLLIDAGTLGMKNFGNCDYDCNGNIWVNEVTGCRIWQFNSGGEVLQVLGDGTPGFQSGSTSFHKVRFNWSYDLRVGSDGNIYVLDSKNYAVRMIDTRDKVVHTIVGIGEGGYSGDGGDADKATLGHNRGGSGPAATFDGPWSLSLDEECNLFIGDTQNRVVRMVERSSNTISTIAGVVDALLGERNDLRETDPLKVKLPLICSLDYYAGQLFIPEWDGELVVVQKSS